MSRIIDVVRLNFFAYESNTYANAREENDSNCPPILMFGLIENRVVMELSDTFSALVRVLSAFLMCSMVCQIALL